MREFEIISQMQGGPPRERDGNLEQPLAIQNIALTTKFSHDFYPLPLFTLTGAVQARQPNLHGTTLARAGNASEILAYVKQTSPSILALSAPQGTLKTLDEILAGLNRFTLEQRPHLILGGGLPTYLAARFFGRYPKLPMTIVGGWGEDAFAEEVKTHSLVPPIPEQKFINGRYPKDYPRQEGVPKKGTVIFHYPRVEASKGCFWGSCIYCLRPLNEKRGEWQQFQPEDVLAQINNLFDLRYTGYFEFADEEPVGTSIDRFYRIIGGLAQMKKAYPTFTFGMNMRADHVISPDPDKQQQYDDFLRKAKKAGLTTIWMGAESYSNSHLQTLGKGPHVSPEINLKAARKLDNLGINVSQGFIPYHPLSNWQELTEMADFMEPHMSFLARTLGSPFGFLRVQHNTPYLDSIRALDSSTTNNHLLLGEFDEDMLIYHCRYQDPSIGLHVAYMWLVYDWINPLMKQMGVETLIGDKMRKNRLDGLRLAGLKLFIRCIRQLEPLKEDLPELERQQLRIICEYKEEISRLGIDVAELDEFIQRKLPIYLDKFL